MDSDKKMLASPMVSGGLDTAVDTNQSPMLTDQSPTVGRENNKKSKPVLRVDHMRSNSTDRK